jgi:hypothetical protein
MFVNKKLIEKTIVLREKKNDLVKDFAIRYKSSPIEEWNKLEPYIKTAFQKIYNQPVVDGVKLKIRHTTLTINGRHRST